MSQENVAVVREQFEATNRREFARPMADWADDIEVVETREGDIRSGTYAGREAVGEFFGAWFRAIQAAACASAEGVRQPTIAGASWTRSSFSRASTMTGQSPRGA